MNNKNPKYLFIKKQKYFLKTVYSFYDSNIYDINNKKDYSLEEPYLSIVLKKFKKVSPINILTKNDILIGKLVYLKKIKEWHFIHRGKKMIIKYANLEDNTNFYFRSLYVLLTNNIVNENFLRSYYYCITNIVKKKKLNDMKYILNKLDKFKNNLSINTCENYKPNEKDVCTICFMKTDLSKRIILPCKHTFHLECFNIWYKQKRVCPLCKYKLSIDSFLVDKDCSFVPSRPTLRNNKLNLVFLPFIGGRASIKNIKLKSSSGNKFKFLKVTSNNFVVEFKEPLKKINAIVISIINFLN